MLKYVDTMVTFSEVPDEISLCIDISNCPCHCKGCHSSYLANDIGTELTIEELHKIIDNNKGVSCLCLMGGDIDPSYINSLATHIKYVYKDLKIAWYSGRQELNKEISLSNFDYIKLGPYEEDKGPLNNSNTNQRFYKVSKGTLEDITYKFWNKNE